MRQYKSQSTIHPLQWDTRSAYVVCHNYNVTESLVDETVMYNYDVTEYTKEEYTEMQSEQNRADIDYIAIMTGVEL